MVLPTFRSHIGFDEQIRTFYDTPSPASDPSGVWSYTWRFSVDIPAAIRRFDGLPPSICTRTTLVEFNYRRCEPRRSWKNNYCRVRKRFCHPLVVPSPSTRIAWLFFAGPFESRCTTFIIFSDDKPEDRGGDDVWLVTRTTGRKINETDFVFVFDFSYRFVIRQYARSPENGVS